MKELTIEQKAKAYDEAFERAKKLQETCDSQAVVGWCEYIFPELKESEDEQHHKWILEYLYDGLRKADEQFKDQFKAAIAWLEKQGKPTYINPSEFDLHLNKLLKQFETLPKKELANSLSFYLNVVQNDGTYKPDEKQGEQKSADKVEPKFKVKYAGSEYNVFETKNIAGVTFYGIEDEPNHIDYVKADNCEIISGYGIKESGLSVPTKPIMFSEKKPKRMISAEAKEAMYDKPACAWSEEDEEMLEKQGKPTDEDMKEALRTEYEKGRADAIVQMQKPWSEEDDEIINGITSYLCTHDSCELDGFNKWYDWLKSLKDRYTWKPSDEQMYTLETAVSSLQSTALESLYNELKKL